MLIFKTQFILSMTEILKKKQLLEHAIHYFICILGFKIDFWV